MLMKNTFNWSTMILTFRLHYYFEHKNDIACTSNFWPKTTCSNLCMALSFILKANKLAESTFQPQKIRGKIPVQYIFGFVNLKVPSISAIRPPHLPTFGPPPLAKHARVHTSSTLLVHNSGTPQPALVYNYGAPKQSLVFTLLVHNSGTPHLPQRDLVYNSGAPEWSLVLTILVHKSGTLKMFTWCKFLVHSDYPWCKILVLDAINNATTDSSRHWGGVQLASQTEPVRWSKTNYSSSWKYTPLWDLWIILTIQLTRSLVSVQWPIEERGPLLVY